MVSTQRTETGVGRDTVPAFGASHRCWGLYCPATTQALGEQGRHHHPQPHAHAGSGITLIIRRLFHGHGRLHLHKFIDIMDHIEPALVVNGVIEVM